MKKTPAKSSKKTVAKKSSKPATKKVVAKKSASRKVSAPSATYSVPSTSKSNSNTNMTPFLMVLIVILILSVISLVFSWYKQKQYFSPKGDSYKMQKMEQRMDY